jgi:hypothetical protein
MAANRWKIISTIAGGVILLLMLAASSFSLGVYVGEHGWTRDGLNYSAGPPAGKAPANDGLPQGGPVLAGTVRPPLSPAGLPAGRPDLTGRILRIRPQSIEVATPNGPRIVNLSPETRFLDEDGRTISLKDLKNGDTIAIFGRFTAGDGGELQADIVVRLQPNP